MVQIGNIHFGSADTAVKPTVNILEASVLWDSLIARYKCIEETQIYHNYAHDADLKAMIKFGIGFLEKQIDELEKQMNIYKLPLPDRPPKSINQGENSVVLSDRFMFQQIFEGCQTFIVFFARHSSAITSNDPLRQMMVKFLTDELFLFDKLVRFAKTKGWLNVPPVYKE